MIRAKINFTILLSIGCLLTFGQTQQAKSFTISTAPAYKDYLARDFIKLLPGYSFKSSSTESFKGRIDESLVCNVDYTSIPNFESLTINKNLTTKVLSGNAEVSEGGQGIYSIPIELPAGINGMQPNLAITYASTLVSTNLGIGWNISGVSTITRVGKQDIYDYTPGDIYEEVLFDETDNFSLDGKRLLGNGNFYFDEEGDKYYEFDFEQSDLTTIYGYDPDDNGLIDRFLLRTSDQKTVEYGYNDAALIYGEQLVEERDEYGEVINTYIRYIPSIYLISKITDQFGNYIKYNYFQDTETGEYRIESIEYTGNMGTGKSPINKVEFLYDTRTLDGNTKYPLNTAVSDNVLLRSIKVISENKHFKSYYFYYTQSFNSKLSKIEEVFADGTKGNPLYIKWGKDNQVEYSQVESHYWTINSIQLPINYNADGRQDLLVYNNANNLQFQVWTKNSADNDFTHAITLPDIPLGNIEKVTVCDFNNDGYDDIVIAYLLFTSYQKPDGTFDNKYVSKFVGYVNDLNSNFEINFECSYDHIKVLNLEPIHSNKDGLVDILVTFQDWEYGTVLNEGDYFYLGLIKEGGFSYFVDLRREEPTDDMFRFDRNKTIEAIDFDGDGVTEILNRDLMEISFILGPRLDIITRPVDYADVRGQKGDFNGDGKTDFYSTNETAGVISYSTGTGFIQVVVPTKISYGKTFDYNGDGKSDLRVGSTIYYFNGKDFIAKPTLLPSTAKDNLFADYNGDGKLDYFEFIKDNYSKLYYLKPYETDNLVTSIYDSKLNKTDFIYKPLTDGTVYSLGINQDETGKSRNISIPMYVVSNLSVTPNGFVHKTVDLDFKYEGLTVNLKGKGFLGFNKMVRTDKVNNIREENVYTLYLPCYAKYLTEQSQYNIANGANELLSYVSNEYTIINYENFKRFEPGGVDEGNIPSYFPALTRISKNNLIDDVTSIETREYSTDNFSKSYLSKTTFNSNNGEVIKETLFNYEDLDESGPTWRMVRLIGTTETSTYKNQTPYNTSTTIAYKAPNNTIVASVTKNVGTSFALKTAYTYDLYGNKTEEKVEGSGKVVPTTYTYDGSARFVTTVKNALNHTKTYTYNSRNQLEKVTDPNGLTVNYEYLGNGKLFKENSSAGNQKTYSDNWVASTDADAPTGALIVSTTTQDDLKPEKIYYDALDRVLRIVRYDALSGKEIYQDKSYNVYGLVNDESLPYYKGATASKTVYTYSYPSKRILTTVGNGNNIECTYIKAAAGKGRTVKVVDKNIGEGSASTKEFNSVGDIISSTDFGGTITYAYNSQGKPFQVIYNDHTTTMEYDQAGNQTKLVDPDKGLVEYTYNVFGELLSQKDNNQIVTMTYDLLGRLLTITEPEGTTTYTYDTKPNAKGKLAKVTAFSGTSEEYFYDTQSRVVQINEKVDSETFDRFYTYGNYGRLATETYPSGFKVRYSYLNGAVKALYRDDDGSLVWQNNETNALGQQVSYKHGNNLITTLGYDNNHCPSTIYTGSIQKYEFGFNALDKNLSYRKDVRTGASTLWEEFTYDQNSHTQLNSWWVKGTQTIYGIQYTDNGIGNIEAKDDVGVYHYDNTPHAVTRITEPTSYVDGSNQNIEYFSFDKVKRIVQNAKSADFVYGADKQRRKMTVQNGTESYTRYYIGNYEKEIKAGVTRELNYISSPYGLEAICVKTGTTYTMYYVHKDYLGSLTCITNAAGTVVERMNFDPWGRRRNANDWTYANVPSSFLFYRGYTGHEHLDEFGLINMNGRLYDPLLARFLSPDNYVQAPDFTQSFNRYSYCLNNPLKYTDPSGEIWNFVIGAVIGGVINWAANGAEFSWEGLGHFAVGAVAGAIGVGIGGAVAGVVGTVGFEAAFTVGAVSGLASGFVLGAGNTALHGGNFGDCLGTGLWNGMITGYTSGFISGLIGGFSALKHGGDFITGEGAILPFIDSEYSNGCFEFANDEELLAWLDNQNICMEDFGVQKITAWEDVYFERGRYTYFRGNDGNLYMQDTKTPNFALTRLGGFCEKTSFNTSNIYMSRISDFRRFTTVLNHELIHAYHYSQGLLLLRGFNNYTEHVAYSYYSSIGYSANRMYDYFTPIAPANLPPYLIPLPY